MCLAPDSSNPAIALGRVLDGHRAGLSTRAAVLKSRYDPCEFGVGWGVVHWVDKLYVCSHACMHACMRGRTFFKPPSSIPLSPPSLGVDNEVETYLNRKDVQEALHVIPGLAPKKWKDCTHDIHYSR